MKSEEKLKAEEAHALPESITPVAPPRTVLFPELAPPERAARIAKMIAETARGMGAEHVVVLLAFPPGKNGSTVYASENMGPNALAIRGLLEMGKADMIRKLHGGG